MAWVQSDLERIEAAIASGVTKVKYQDKEVEYRSIDEMLKARDLIRRELGQTKRTQRVQASFNKGLCNADD